MSKSLTVAFVPDAKHKEGPSKLSPYEYLRSELEMDSRLLQRVSPLHLVGSEPAEWWKDVDVLIVGSLFDKWNLFPKLKLVCAAWAGVDKLIGNPEYPKHIQLVRLVDPHMAQRMSLTVLMHVLAEFGQLHAFRECQARKDWNQNLIDGQRGPDSVHIGVIGMGELGSHISKTLVANGFTSVSGWGRSSRVLKTATLSGSEVEIPISKGDSSLLSILHTSDIVINMLPLTKYTEGLFNYSKFCQMKRGAVFMNFGRGRTVNEQDLEMALNDDNVGLGRVILDVFSVEPLPLDSVLWSHPRVVVTPHVSGPTNYQTAAKVITESIASFLDGKSSIPGTVDAQNRGY